MKTFENAIRVTGNQKTKMTMLTQAIGKPTSQGLELGRNNVRTSPPSAGTRYTSHVSEKSPSALLKTGLTSSLLSQVRDSK